MHLKQFSAVVLCLAVLLFARAASAGGLPEFTDLAASCGPAVVNINTERSAAANGPEDMFGDMFRNMPPGFERFFRFGPRQGRRGPARKQKSLGSGFLISADGYIVTNNHVVANAEVIRVTLDEKTYKGEPIKAKLVGSDEETDLALLKIDIKQDLPFLKFGDSDELKVGEWLLAIGNPFGLDHSVTAGILSAKGRRINAGAFDNFLQTDASINPGNSGGPLINMKGEVIGINTAIIASGQGIGFAIPSNMANEIIDQVRGGKKVSRGWLGVGIQDVDQNTAKALGLAEPKGALVGSVQKDQPADKAGIKDGDVIVAINGKDIEDTAELLRTIAKHQPGTEVKVTVWRDGARQDFTVKLGDRSENLTADNAIRGRSGDASTAEATLGLTLRPLRAEEAKALKLEQGGLVVVAIEDGKPAASADLQVDDVILKANMKPVKTTADLAKVVKEEGVKRGAVLLQINRRGDQLFRTVSLEKK
ncbi:MAG: DegQ family serine endoprotease [Desulfovibrio sp.]|nr:DegQ family serine endoprotease [Desulfovibrio sp.]